MRMHSSRWSVQFFSFPLQCNWNVVRIYLIIMIEQISMAVASPKCAYFLEHSTFMNIKDDKQEKHPFSHLLLPSWYSQNRRIGVGKDLFNISRIFFFFFAFVDTWLWSKPAIPWHSEGFNLKKIDAQAPLTEPFTIPQLVVWHLP